MSHSSIFAMFLMSCVAGCSLISSGLPAGSGTASSAAAETSDKTGTSTSASTDKSTNEARCARAVNVVGPEPGPNMGSELRTRRNRWQPVAEAAARDQFVVSKEDISMALNWDHIKWLKRTVPAGEPLVLIKCFRPTDPKNGTATLMTFDGIYEKTVPLASLDMNPTSFTWNAPVFESKLSALDLAFEAHKDDKDAVAGWRDLYDKYSKCKVEATGKCMAAEKKVASGPPRADMEEAQAKACRAAADTVYDGCLGKGGRAKFDKLSVEVHALSLKRDAALDVQMHEKLK